MEASEFLSGQEPGEFRSSVEFDARVGSKPGNGGVGQFHPFPACHRSTLQCGADYLGRLLHRGVGKVDIFERGFWIAVTEQPADGQHGLALPERQAGYRMAQVVKMHVFKFRLGSDPVPEPVEPGRAAGPVGPRCGEYPKTVWRKAVEDGPGRFGEPHGPGARLAVAQKQAAVTVVRPLQGQDLALAAARQQQ